MYPINVYIQTVFTLVQNKILHQLQENECSAVRGGIFEISANFITLVFQYNQCNIHFSKKKEKT